MGTLVGSERGADRAATVLPGATVTAGSSGAHGARVAPLGHRPALDGLRGLALLAIIAFHGQVDGVDGAFLSVSTFFTLSGFLITTVLLVGIGPGRNVGVRRFYRRRARRLLPAALLAVVTITVTTALVGDAGQQGRLRGDSLSSLVYVTNWRLVAAGDSYDAIFQSPSLFTHFWTLAIEEQFYLLFPLVVAFVVWSFGGSLRAMMWSFGAMVLAAVGWSIALQHGGASVDRLYFGADTRLPELLVGGMLALWWARVPRMLGPGAQRALAWAGCVAFFAMVWLWHAADRRTPWLYHGGLVGYSLLTCLVIVGALQPVGPLRRALAWRPLVLVGVVSYGAYLLHWPVLVVLQQRTPWSAPARLAVGVAITLVLAWVSYRWIERPIRSGERLPGRRLFLVAGPAVVTVALLIAALTPSSDAPQLVLDLEATSAALADLQVQTASSAQATTAARPGPESAAAAAAGSVEGLGPAQRQQWDAWAAAADAEAGSADGPPRVAFFGDSTALLSGYGVSRWANDHLEAVVPVRGVTGLGCGLVPEAVERSGGVESRVAPASCQGWMQQWEDAVVEWRTDVAVVQFGPWDVYDTRLEEQGPTLAIGHDAAFDDLLRSRLHDAVDMLLRHVDTVVVLRSPDVVVGRTQDREPPRPLRASDPARMERFRQLADEVVAAHAGAGSVDLASYVATHDSGTFRPDGVHLSNPAADQVGAWLAPQIRSIYDDVVATCGRAPSAPSVARGCSPSHNGTGGQPGER